MAFKFITIPIHDGSEAEAELNQFLNSYKILSVDRRWVDQGAASFWTFCVDYLPRPLPGGGATAPNMRGKIDYREVLKPEDFAVFALLRDWRKAVSQEEAVPVYTIFTNEQLAQKVQTRAKTKAALEKIPGIGAARVDKYGDKILAQLIKAWPSDETSGPTV